MKPTIGRIVHFCIGPNYGEPVLRPAMIVRVWSDTCVNLVLFPDGSNDDSYLRDLQPSETTHQERGGALPWLTSILQGEDVGEWRWPEVTR